MFADSFCDSGWSTRSHRGWTTLASFALQALVVGCLLILPLLYTQGLPRLTLLVPQLLAPAPPPSPAPPPRIASSAVRSNMMGIRLVSPSQIPPTVNMLTETAPPPPMADPNMIGISHGTGDTSGRGNVLEAILGYRQVLPPPPVAEHRPPTSHMMEGNLILRVQPDYPSLARQVRVQGQVVLRAIISREGTIEKLQVLSGHPMLVQAAVDAVRQWRYRPYVLNGGSVEVETEVKVNFVLSGG